MSTENEGAAVPSEAKPPTGPQPDRASASASGAQTPGAPPAAPPPPDFAPTVTPASGGGFDGPGRMPPYHDGRVPQPGYGHPGDDPTADRTAQIPAYPGAGAGGGGWGQQPPHGGGDPWGTTGGPVPKRRNGGLIAAVLVAALVAGGIGGGIGFWAAGQNDSASTTVSASGDPGALNRKPTSVSGIAQKALPSVVTIEAQGATGEGGTGTGFIYDKQGHILTNNHVVASAADGGKLTATFSNGKKYDAEVVGHAQGYDVAVIKLKNASGAQLNPLPLGKSSNVQVGDATIAIGAPFGLSGTVTTGIISAKDRPVASSDGGGTSASYMSALQTDASINPGNSGGPLMDAAGNVIGINSAIQSAGNGGGLGGESQQSGSIGLGFAIPIDQARRVAQDLIRTGKPVYPQIGVQVGMRDTGNGATIARTGNNGSDAVTPNGPADKAGLKPGDTITKLDDTVVDSGPTLISEIWQHKPGDQVTLTYKRGGKEHTAHVTLGQRTGDK
ncbi:trypsin-like peptidase domain-containing protein [Streptomyces angustmyceticus]|uniref:Protease n=1 Tax=Streptomyces angustmyceticus TaxID=285578 RepID=A0A5J4LE53_9ACTN|nr:trypsin-like peptidase domain-containing protein [Streptomyces angustmyceticus]UAL68035.1 trypsin-like peptidase domain-containing protein [Streptomyces angustmyceticus]GES30794.1 protease [Streptomyces angustmyceticus]